MKIFASMTITTAEGLPALAKIEVSAEYDEGYAASAQVGWVRCWANTAERAVTWEMFVGDSWARVSETATSLPDALRRSMARAAHAGLVACGARSVS